MFETANTVEALYNRSIDVVAKLRARGDVRVECISEPARRSPRFSISRTAELVGRTSASIRDAEKDGRLPNVPRTQSGRRVGYTLAELNAMRTVFGTEPRRATLIRWRSSRCKILRAASVSRPYRCISRSIWRCAATVSV